MGNRLLTAGAAGAGAYAGTKFEDTQALALLAALFGRRGLAFSSAAALAGQNPRALFGVSPLPDIGMRGLIDPLSPITDPAAVRLLRKLGILDE